MKKALTTRWQTQAGEEINSKHSEKNHLISQSSWLLLKHLPLCRFSRKLLDFKEINTFLFLHFLFPCSVVLYIKTNKIIILVFLPMAYQSVLHKWRDPKVLKYYWKCIYVAFEGIWAALAQVCSKTNISIMIC